MVLKIPNIDNSLDVIPDVFLIPKKEETINGSKPMKTIKNQIENTSRDGLPKKILTTAVSIVKNMRKLRTKWFLI